MLNTLRNDHFDNKYPPEPKISIWQQWLQHPEKVRLRKAVFQFHLWVGASVSLYVVLMSISGSVIVFRNEIERAHSVAAVEWLVKFHKNLFSGDAGSVVNGIGAICLTLLAVTGAIIWWPGIGNWRRAVSLNWTPHFARFSWDLHSALGFWSLFFVFAWGLSGIYFSFPQLFNSLFALLDPGDKFTDRTLLWLSLLHFGRFGWFAEVLWGFLGLMLSVLSFSGLFLCCRRMIYKIPPARP